MDAPEHKTLIIGLKPHGFFSMFNCVLNHIVHSLYKNGIMAIRIEWKKDYSTRFSYGTHASGNIWEKYFEPLKFDIFPKKTVFTADYANDSMTGLKAYYHLYRRGNKWREVYHRAFRKYIKIKSHIMERVELFYQKNMKDYFCVGVHYRNPRHWECPEPIPLIELFLNKARKMMPKDQKSLIFLATDVDGALDRFKEEFGEQLIFQKNIIRAKTLNDEQIHIFPSNPNVRLGEEVLVDCLLLSRCNALLHVTSNISTAVGYINPEISMEYCEKSKLKALLLYFLKTSDIGFKNCRAFLLNIYLLITKRINLRALFNPEYLINGFKNNLSYSKIFKKIFCKHNKGNLSF